MIGEEDKAAQHHTAETIPQINIVPVTIEDNAETNQEEIIEAEIEEYQCVPQVDRCNPFKELYQCRSKAPKNLIFSHLNVNSIRYKFICLKDLLVQYVLDYLVISESKLNASHPKSEFNVNIALNLHSL